MNDNHQNLVETMFPSDGSGIKPYEWMISPTRQRQWIDENCISCLCFTVSGPGS
jgi:hypothetical protein